MDIGNASLYEEPHKMWTLEKYEDNYFELLKNGLKIGKVLDVQISNNESVVKVSYFVMF